MRLPHALLQRGEHARHQPAQALVLDHPIGAVLAEDESLPAPDELAAAVVAVLQGGYVLARAAGDRAPFDRAITGAIRLLKASTQGDR